MTEETRQQLEDEINTKVILQLPKDGSTKTLRQVMQLAKDIVPVAGTLRTREPADKAGNHLRVTLRMVLKAHGEKRCRKWLKLCMTAPQLDAELTKYLQKKEGLTISLINKLKILEPEKATPELKANLLEAFKTWEAKWLKEYQENGQDKADSEGLVKGTHLIKIHRDWLSDTRYPLTPELLSLAL